KQSRLRVCGGGSAWIASLSLAMTTETVFNLKATPSQGKVEPAAYMRFRMARASRAAPLQRAAQAGAAPGRQAIGGGERVDRGARRLQARRRGRGLRIERS